MTRIKTIGIPRAMYYFEYAEKWVKFFANLGFKVIVSGKTDAICLNEGVKSAPDDTCLPVKAMYGHTLSLIKEHKNLDYIFLPRIMKTCSTAYTCPKTMGLTDMLKSTVADLPEVIDCAYTGSDLSFFMQVGKRLGKNRAQITSAYLAALKNLHTSSECDADGEKPLIAVIGHSYILRDNFLNMDIFDILRELGVEYVTPAAEDSACLRTLAHSAGYKQTFWHHADKILGFTKKVTDENSVDGILFLSSFGCGTDPLTLPVCIDYIGRKNPRLPFAQIDLDEHRSTEGFRTRIEAFCECISAAKARV